MEPNERELNRSVDRFLYRFEQCGGHSANDRWRQFDKSAWRYRQSDPVKPAPALTILPSGVQPGAILSLVTASGITVNLR